MKPPTTPSPSVSAQSESKYLTEAELERLERDNLLRVLEAANWKIKGPGGAAVAWSKAEHIAFQNGEVGIEETGTRTA